MSDEHRDDVPALPPLPRPQPNRVCSEPATVQTCRTDYEDAAGIRARFNAQIRRAR